MKCKLSRMFPRILVSLFCLSATMLISGCGDSMTTAPTTTGIVLCERLELFPSGHVSLIRVHSGYRFPSFPAKASFCTFAQLPGFKDGLEYQYKIKDSDGSDVAFSKPEWSKSLDNPAFAHKVSCDFQDVVFSHAGQYDVVLEVNKKSASKATLVVEQGGAAPGSGGAAQNPNQPPNPGQ